MPLSADMNLVTGATGFVGSSLIAALLQEPAWSVTAITRRPWSHQSPKVRSVAVGDLAEACLPAGLLADTDAVVHAAAMTSLPPTAAAERVRAVNVGAAVALARQAAKAGVRRFLFLSSIKVNGEETAPGRPFTAQDTPAPQDLYGRSKCEAERALQALAEETGLELVIIRPSLIYGPGVGGNFAQMVRWVARGVPLPFASVNNKRTLLALPNLLDLLKIEKKTVIFVTHSIEEAAYLSDQIVLLSQRPGTVLRLFRPNIERSKSPDEIRRDKNYLDAVDEIWRILRQYV